MEEPKTPRELWQKDLIKQADLELDELHRKLHDREREFWEEIYYATVLGLTQDSRVTPGSVNINAEAMANRALEDLRKKWSKPEKPKRFTERIADAGKDEPIFTEDWAKTGAVVEQEEKMHVTDEPTPDAVPESICLTCRFIGSGTGRAWCTVKNCEMNFLESPVTDCDLYERDPKFWCSNCKWWATKKDRLEADKGFCDKHSITRYHSQGCVPGF